MQKWHEPFSEFVRDTRYRADRGSNQKNTEQQEISKESTGFQEQHTPTLREIQERWDEFLKHLDEKNLAILHSHLTLCELVKFEHNKLSLLCKNAMTYETLQEDSPRLSHELALFFKARMEAMPVFDKDVAEANRVKSPKELFEELAKSNEVIQYLIKEFGAELIQ